MLFIADRKVLRDQAYNTFAPFVDSQSDPRNILGGGRFNPYRDIYFSLYQALDAEDDGEPLFKRIPADLFGLIIIDECHRSGFGKWNDILQHFPEAIKLGKAKRGGYSKFRYLQFNNFAISTLFRA